MVLSVKAMFSLSIAYKVALMGALPFSLAIPAGSRSLDVNNPTTQITIEKDLATFETELSVLNSDSQIVASSCSNHLDLPALNISVTADVDDRGSGQLTLNSVVYNIHENATFSGGISCSRMHSDRQVFVICSAPLTDTNYSALSLQSLVTSQKDCFKAKNLSIPGSQSLRGHAMAMIYRPSAKSQPALNDISVLMDGRSIENRQGGGIPCGVWTATTKAVDNPDPHQNYYLKQLSVRLLPQDE